MAVTVWRVHDTGLVAVPSRFRRLGGLVRHHRGRGVPWPAQVTLTVDGDELVVTAPGLEVGRWPRAEVEVRPVAAGPPVHLVVTVPGGEHLLAAPAGAALEQLLTDLVR